MAAFHVVVIGGAGLFGSRVAAALARDPSMAVTLAGRRLDALHGVIASVQPHACAAITAAQFDIDSTTFDEDLRNLAPDCVIHAAGPFQQRDYSVARAALAAGAHCIDLADGRAFVGGIHALDAQARAAGRWVISGASSVPGLSSAVVAAHAPRFARLDRVETAISPGNRTDRGLATTQAILGYVGQPFTMWRDGRWQNVRGWTSLRRLRDPHAGTRWLARCDVPDLDLLPARHPSLRTCGFRAGLELRRMHFGLWLLACAVRAGLVRDAPRWAPRLLAMSGHWRHAGSDLGLMRVDMRGLDADARPLHLRWTLLAHDGDGPNVPATPSVVLARKLAGGGLPGSGARPCMDLFSLEDCMAELAPWSITTRSERVDS